MDAIDVLIVGAGLAGSRCAEALRAGGFDGGIVIAGDERHAPYERPALSKAALVEGRGAPELSLRADAFWADNGIELRTGTHVTELDLEGHTARLDGQKTVWRRLVLATGARARSLPGLPDVAGIHRLRTLDDASRLRHELVPGARLAIIGAGFVGCEVASSARALGVEVTMLEAAPLPLVAIVGEAVAERLAERIRAAGVDLRLSFAVASLDVRNRRVGAVLGGDGARVECDLVLVAVGAQPNTGIVADLLELAPDRGIPTCAGGRTRAPDVFACGDVASPWRDTLGRNQRLEHWTSADHGARAVAATMLDREPAAAAPPYFWSDQFGVRLQMVGHAGAGLDVTVDHGADGLAAHYHDTSGALVAGLVVNRPHDLPAMRQSLTARSQPRRPAGGVT